MIRKAVRNDVNDIMRIINEAKAYLKNHDIPQWQDGYPDASTIEADIVKAHGYVLVKENKVIGYSAIIYGDDLNYHLIVNGEWLNDEPYGVIHRTCIDNAYKGNGLVNEIYDFAKEEAIRRNIHNLRIDTHELNLSMQRCVEKYGFKKCGIVYMRDGAERFAYHIKI